MKNYIGTKLIKAEPMNYTNFCILKGILKSEECNKEDYNKDGYYVQYPDGYTSWSPKSVFEKAYLEVIPNPRLKTDISISQSMVDNFIKEVKVLTIDNKTTLVTVILVNGFEITETSSCVDPENYNEEIGKEVCLDRIKDKIWMLLGFLLQTAVNGIK